MNLYDHYRISWFDIYLFFFHSFISNGRLCIAPAVLNQLKLNRVGKICSQRLFNFFVKFFDNFFLFFFVLKMIELPNRFNHIDSFGFFWPIQWLFILFIISRFTFTHWNDMKLSLCFDFYFSCINFTVRMHFVSHKIAFNSLLCEKNEKKRKNEKFRKYLFPLHPCETPWYVYIHHRLHKCFFLFQLLKPVVVREARSSGEKKIRFYGYCCWQTVKMSKIIRVL